MRLHERVLMLLTVVMVGLGVSELWASRPVARPPICDDWNWCAPSRNGQSNCDACCDLTTGIPGGFCNSQIEEDAQGCICLG
jgi:hypothetical protein